MYYCASQNINTQTQWEEEDKIAKGNDIHGFEFLFCFPWEQETFAVIFFYLMVTIFIPKSV